MKGFVVGSAGVFRIDPLLRFDSLMIEELILTELQRFLKRHYPEPRPGHLLDLGAGSRPYLPVYKEYFASTTALDFRQATEENPLIDVCGSAEHLPFQDKSFDCIICTEVLEHLPNPMRALQECERVLRPGGYLFLTTPFFHPLHEKPFDFFRYTPYVYQHMGREAGLNLEYINERGGPGGFLLLLVLHLLFLGGVRLHSWLGWGGFTRSNPLIHPIFIWPQWLWLWFWKRENPDQPQVEAIDKQISGLSGMTLGYAAYFRKPD